MTPITTKQRACLKRAANIIEKKAEELSTYYCCSNSGEWDSFSAELQYHEYMGLVRSLHDVADSKTSRI